MAAPPRSWRPWAALIAGLGVWAAGLAWAVGTRSAGSGANVGAGLVSVLGYLLTAAALIWVQRTRRSRRGRRIATAALVAWGLYVLASLAVGDPVSRLLA